MKSATLAESEGGLYSECPTRVTRRVVELSPVGRTSSPITVLTRVDLPAPELPKKPITDFFLRFANNLSVSSNASNSLSDGRKSGFTAATFDLRSATLLSPSESRSETLFFFPRGIGAHHPCSQVSLSEGSQPVGEPLGNFILFSKGDRSAPSLFAEGSHRYLEEKQPPLPEKSSSLF